MTTNNPQISAGEFLDEYIESKRCGCYCQKKEKKNPLRFCVPVLKFSKPLTTRFWMYFRTGLENLPSEVQQGLQELGRADEQYFGTKWSRCRPGYTSSHSVILFQYESTLTDSLYHFHFWLGRTSRAIPSWLEVVQQSLQEEPGSCRWEPSVGPGPYEHRCNRADLLTFFVWPLFVDQIAYHPSCLLYSISRNNTVPLLRKWTKRSNIVWSSTTWWVFTNRNKRMGGPHFDFQGGSVNRAN